MTPQLLIKRTGLLNQICSIGFGADGGLHADIISSHFSILKAGNSLRMTILALESLGRDADQRVRKDKQKAKIVAAINAHSTFCNLANKYQQYVSDKYPQLELEQGNLVPLPAPEEPASGAANEEKPTQNSQKGTLCCQCSFNESAMDLLQVDSASPFNDLVESKELYDTLSRHLVMHSQNLDNFSKQLSASISKVSGENNWKVSLPHDAELKDVLQKGAATLLKMEQRGTVGYHWTRLTVIAYLNL